MKTCPSCGKKFADDKKFCNLDGTALIVFEIPEEETAMPEQTASEEHFEDNSANSAVGAGNKINNDAIINNNETYGFLFFYFILSLFYHPCHFLPHSLKATPPIILLALLLCPLYLS